MTNKNLDFNKAILIFIIVLLAALPRFYKLGLIPPSLDWDETSNAYNAYSILKTGRDEYGNFLPLTNRSFDDYKPPLYMYLTIPAVAVFGLNPFSARLVSALAGIFTIPMVYWLALVLFKEDKNRKKIALLAAFFLAVSPWHLQFSRVGFEANLGLFMTVGAVLTFLKGFEKKGFFLVAAIFSSLSFYAYHSQRIIIPLLFIGLLFLYKKIIFEKNLRNVVIFIFLNILLILPLLLFAPKNSFLSRFSSSSSESRIVDTEKSKRFIKEDKDQGIGFMSFIHIRRIVTAQAMFSNYLANFDPNFLFISGDSNPRHHIEKMGALYLFELPLILYSVYWFFKWRKKGQQLLLIWLLISPLAASPVQPSPHALRVFTMVIPFALLSAFAFSNILSNGFKFKRKIAIIFGIWIVFSSAVYLHNYLVHYRENQADAWQFGYKEAAIESERQKNLYDKIVVDSSIEQAYVFWLFNLKYDPREYQKNHNKTHFDKYYFGREEPHSDFDLYVAEAKKFPKRFKVVKTIYYPNGKEAIKIGHQ